jgi:hypothetical protein
MRNKSGEMLNKSSLEKPLKPVAEGARNGTLSETALAKKEVTTEYLRGLVDKYKQMVKGNIDLKDKEFVEGVITDLENAIRFGEEAGR